MAKTVKNARRDYEFHKVLWQFSRRSHRHSIEDKFCKPCSFALVRADKERKRKTLKRCLLSAMGKIVAKKRQLRNKGFRPNENRLLCFAVLTQRRGQVWGYLGCSERLWPVTAFICHCNWQAHQFTPREIHKASSWKLSEKLTKLLISLPVHRFWRRRHSAICQCWLCWTWMKSSFSIYNILYQTRHATTPMSEVGSTCTILIMMTSNTGNELNIGKPLSELEREDVFQIGGAVPRKLHTQDSRLGLFTIIRSLIRLWAINKSRK